MLKAFREKLLSTYLSQLKGIHFLQESLPLKKFFYYWDYLDTFAFSLFFILVLWSFNKKPQYLLISFFLLLSYMINTYLKEYFFLPRPHHLDLSVGIQLHSSMGFPSGASQTAALFFGIACFESIKKTLRLGAALFCLALCFSRIYLGVHFFTDVLAGVGIGSFLVLFYPLAKSSYLKSPPRALGVFLFILALFYSRRFLPHLCLFAGLGIGEVASEAFSPLGKWEKVGGLIGFFLLFSLRSYFPFYGDFLAAFWLTFLGPAMMQRLASKV